MATKRDANDILREEGADALRAEHDAENFDPEPDRWWDQHRQGEQSHQNGERGSDHEWGNQEPGQQHYEPIVTREAAELLAKPAPVREWFVPQWMPAHDVTLLGGDGGTGKTMLALQLAIAGQGKIAQVVE
jgi:RecA-family ATPase